MTRRVDYRTVAPAGVKALFDQKQLADLTIAIALMNVYNHGDQLRVPPAATKRLKTSQVAQEA